CGSPTTSPNETYTAQPAFPTCSYCDYLHDSRREDVRYGLSCSLSYPWQVPTVEMWPNRQVQASFAIRKRRTVLCVTIRCKLIVAAPVRRLMRPPFRSKQEVVINAPLEAVWAFSMDLTKIPGSIRVSSKSICLPENRFANRACHISVIFLAGNTPALKRTSRWSRWRRSSPYCLKTLLG